ncbi:MAG: A/G-specific adenine glycosylase [Bacteroidetes bacterium]|nr:A/G-specific adenine glycosylase [Bacteroidota bacterium]
MHPFSQKLILWYQVNKRDLPWRNTNDPYKIWLSEVILQQTRVEQGMPYFIKFIEKYPTVKLLASEHIDEVLKLWQGLGYYSRARNMHQTAKQIVDEYGGVFPADYHHLLKLKGVGEYTAAAIASFAYDLPHAVVDGNVYRVLSRLYNIDTPINISQSKKIYTEIAQELLPIDYPAEFNQAMMEFGSLQCKPSSPDCSICIFNNDCLGLKNNKVSQLPVKVAKKPVTKKYLNYLFISDINRLWMLRRNADSIWKNLYDLPCVESEKDLTWDELNLDEEFKSYIGGFPIVLKSQKSMIHKLTHRELHASFWEIEVKKDFVLNKNAIFETYFHLIDNFAVSRLLEKYINEHIKTNR